MSVKTKRINPLQKYYDLCNCGNSKQKFLNLPAFPRLIDIELTNNCNFRCLMCPTGTLSHKRKKGFMDENILLKILDEISKYKTPLRFIRWGEPMLHPQFLSFVREANQRKTICHVNTNGSLLNEEKIEQILEIPLDSIKFSFQGVDRNSYKEMRNTDYFDDLLKKVKLLYNLRADNEYPYIHVSTTITYESKEQVISFKKNVSEFTDLVTVGRTILEHININDIKLPDKYKNTILNLKSQESVVKKYLDCVEVFDKLSINWDGSVSACCGDYDNYMIIGDLNQSSLEEIWNSKKMNTYRKILAVNGHKRFKLCKSCFDYHELQTPGLQQT